MPGLLPPVLGRRIRIEPWSRERRRMEEKVLDFVLGFAVFFTASAVILKLCVIAPDI